MKNRKLCQWLCMLLAALVLCGSVTLTTNTTEVHAASNQEKVFTYLVSNLGLNAAGASGIMANIQCESSFNPDASGSGGKFYGICQWGYERKTALYTYCKENGYIASSLEGQLHYLEYELRNEYDSLLTKLQQIENSASGAYQAGYDWCYYFERPGDIEATSAKRGVLARDTYWPEYNTYKVLPFISYIETQNGTLFEGTAQIRGWAADGDEVVRVEARINGITVSGMMTKRGDVDAAYPEYTEEKKGFLIEILPKDLLDGENNAELVAYTKTGASYPVGSITFTYTKLDHVVPVISDVTVSDVSETGYMVSCTVTDESGIDRVMFPTWTEWNGQDDLVQDWKHADSCKGTIDPETNRVTFRVDSSAHRHEAGTYITHIYAYDSYGNLAMAVTGCEVPLGTVMYGDVDDSSQVEAADALEVLRHVTELIQLDRRGLEAADVNADDKVDAADALLILKRVVNLIDVFPAEQSGQNQGSVLE